MFFTDLVQNLLFGIAVGSIYAIIAVGFTIVFSTTGIVNFAQGEFVMLGAMTSFWLTGDPSAGGRGLPVIIGVPIAILLTLVVGMALGLVLIRPLKTASPTSLIIITVGVSIVMQGIASHIWGKDAVSVPAFTAGDPLLLHLPKALTHTDDAVVMLQQQHLWVMGLAAVMVIILSLFFSRTMLGKAMRAVAMNRHGARLVGINVSRMVITAFAFSAAMGAVAGAAIAPISGGYYNMGTMLGLKGFAAAIVGGLGNFPGSVVAGILLGIAEQMGAFYLSSDYKDAFAFIILLVVLVVSPNGILAWWKKRRAR